MPTKRPLKRSQTPQQSEKTVVHKANHILTIALLAFLIIFLRIWYLCVIQHDDLTARARSPQKKLITTKAPRGTICDRDGIYLARNKIAYNATVIYSPIRQIPRSLWSKDPSGSKERKYPRKEHIYQLSQALGTILGMDPERIEDLIHSKASLFPNAPYAIKTDISEQEFYALKSLEKDLPGLYAERTSKRYYPKGKVAGSMIGYLGAISQEEYRNVIEEKSTLEFFLEQIDRSPGTPLPEGYHSIPEVWNRLRDLKEKAYSFHDSLGKTGIEGKYEDELRGYHGKRVYFSDSKGVFLKELPGRKDPIPGKKIQLALSCELQEYAEKLLINNEKIREGKSREFDWDKRVFVSLKQPWIKGGAIVAFDPRNGEVLAMASYPRIDPSDFVSDTLRINDNERYKNIHRWLETEHYLELLWQGEDRLERETLSNFKKDVSIETVDLSLETYLAQALPSHSPATAVLLNHLNLERAYFLLSDIEDLKEAYPKHELGDLINQMYPNDHQYPVSSFKKQDPIPAEELIPFKNNFDPVFLNVTLNREKVLIVDIARLLFQPSKVLPLLDTNIRKIPLSEYRKISQEFFAYENHLKDLLYEIFHEDDFPKWRKKHFKAYLRSKRKEEEDRETYARPWVDYLDQKEKSLFQELWQELKLPITLATLTGSFNHLTEREKHYALKMMDQIASKPSEKLRNACKALSTEDALSFLQSFRHYQDLNQPLYGRYPNIRKSKKGQQLEKDLATAFYPVFGFNYGRSHAYQLSGVLGSIFKLVTSYTGLLQKYEECSYSNPTQDLINPFEMIDKVERIKEGVWRVGYTLDGQAIPQIYKGGRLPRTAHRNVGKVDVVKALEVSSNSYFSLLACDVLETPNVLKNTASLFSFGNKTGIDLPSEFEGRLPQDLDNNRTGAYTFAIGQHTLLTTPLQTAVMMSTIANGGYVLKPKAILSITGQEPERNPSYLFYDRKFPFQKELNRIGINFPLFTKLIDNQEKEAESTFPTEWQRKLPMPEPIRNTLLDGMYRVVHGAHGTARKRVVNNYPWNHPAYLAYTSLLGNLIGKTSTSQVRDQVGIDVEKPAHMYKNIWFGGIGFSNGETMLSETSLPIPKHSKLGEPEIVVIAYLRYGDSGGEAAPLVAAIMEKWREIKARSTP